MARTTIDPQLRAAALADLLAGEQPAVVAERHGLNPATVRQWKARLGTAAPVATIVAAPTHRKPALEAQQASMGELILGCLRSQLQAIQAVAEITTDPEWVKRQSAAELAVFGQWLVSSALSIGDRLAHGAPAPE
ncbi:MAG: helix-turn-helix domain-containing protein [Chloroflexales bacterium]